MRGCRRLRGLTRRRQGLGGCGRRWKREGMGEAMLVEARGLVKEYGAGARVVDDVSFVIERGETLGLVGESGSGKSTVARMLLRLIEPTAGEVLYAGRDLLAMGSEEMRG